MKQKLFDFAMKLLYRFGPGFLSIVLPLAITFLGIAPMFCEPAAVPDGGDSISLTVMSFNVYVFGTGDNSRENRAGRVTKTIIDSAPDVFGLQEADLDWMNTVSAALPDYAYVGVGRDDAQTKGEFSPVFYDKNRFDVVDSGTFWFSKTPDKPSFAWGAAIRRICSWAVLEEKSSGFRFAVFNSHFDNVSLLSRINSAKLLAEKTAEYAGDIPVIATGDFNSSEDEKTYDILVSGELGDAKYLARESMNSYTYHGYAGNLNSKNKAIDHVLVTEKYAEVLSYSVITHEVDGHLPSDHFPLLVKLKLSDSEVKKMTRVMSFNILCGGDGVKDPRSRAKAVAQAITSSAPDSFGLQEATPEWMLGLKCALSKDYDYVGVGRDDGDNKGEYSPVFYRKDKFELLDSGNFWISQTPEKPSMGWDAVCIRICTWAKLKNRETGVIYVHMNTHLDHVGDTARVEGVKMIREKAESFDVPVVITGDFNVSEGSDCYNAMLTNTIGDSRYLAREAKIYGTFHALEESWLERVEKEPEENTIDFIFVTKNSVVPVKHDVITEKFDGVLPSDHFPVVCDLYFK